MCLRDDEPRPVWMSPLITQVEMESLQFVGCSWFIGLIGLGFGFTQNKSYLKRNVRFRAPPPSPLAHT